MRITVRRSLAATLSGVCALATLLLATPAQASAAAAPSAKVGFAGGSMLVWESNADLARDLDNMAATGAGWVRVDFDWPSIEATKGQFTWANTDRVVSAVKARGMRVLALPTYTPAWARPAGTSDKTPPTSNADFANFVRVAAQRYSGQGIQHWEIWNEPNSKWFWAPAPDAARYASLLQAGSAAIKSVNPAARIVTGGTSPAADAADGSMISPLTFIRAIYDAGVQASFDAVGHHPYSFPVMPMEPGTDAWNSFRHLIKIHDLMVSRGDGAKQVWSTEFGAPTGTEAVAVSPSRQAAIATQAIDQIHAWSWAGPIFWYSHRDAGTNLADREDNFGLWYRDFSPKPALAAFSSAIAATSTPAATPSPANATTGNVTSPSAPAASTSPAYRLVGDRGEVLSFGAADLGSVPVAVNQPIVGSATTASGNGYWLVARDGGIFAFGDAVFYGSTGDVRLNQPIVGMAATPTGRGYWLVARDGGIFAFGDAPFHGSTGDVRLNQPIVGMAATPTGRGYWMVARDGGIFAFGDALFHGSTGNIVLNQPIVGMASAPRGDGYWMVASDGGMFTFGLAAFHGSTAGMGLGRPVTGMKATADGNGYWLTAGNGDVFSFGNAPFLGSAASAGRAAAVIDIA